MKTMHALVMATMMAIGAGSCRAEGAQKSRQQPAQSAGVKWVKEPSQFIGLNVDGSEANLCEGDAPCRTPGLDGNLVPLTKLPDLGFWFDAWAFEFEGKVAYVQLSFDHRYAAQMAALLVQKYGSPSAKRTGVVSSVLGTRVSDAQYQWRGRKVDILFKEHDDNLAKGSVLVTSISVWDAYQADYVKRNGNPADHL